MLREYQLTNFKAFSGPETIPIRPITLIYGPNSSGKSSVVQLLLLLKQTIDEAENPETLLLPKGNLVDLGGYREFVHSHDVSRLFSFKVVLEVQTTRFVAPPWSLPLLKLIDPPLLGLRITFGHDERTANAILSSVELFIGDQSLPAITYKPAKIGGDAGRAFRRFRYLEMHRGGLPETILKVHEVNFKPSFWEALWNARRQQVAKEELPEVTKRLEALHRRLERYQEGELPEQQEELPRSSMARRNRTKKELMEEISFLERLRQSFESYTFEEARKEFEGANQNSGLFCRNFLPIGAGDLRAEDPSAHAEISDFLPVYGRYGSLDLSGVTLHACSTFRRFIEGMIYIGPLRDYPERHYIFSGNLSEHVGKSGKMVPDVLFKNRQLLERVNEQLDRFGLGYELKVSSVSDETSGLSDVFALRLLDKGTGVNVSILDVGCGISQVLPIIVQSMLSRNKTLCIEQPEIHLHPRLQADLGSLLAECIRPPFENRFIIETHSEHLILRIQRLIREQKLTPKDVSVIYVDRGPDGSRCLPLRLDEEGDFIDEWPGGFFEEGYREIFHS